MSAGRARVQPAGVPRCETTSPYARSFPSSLRTTTGLVRTLAAMLSDVAGPPPRRACSSTHSKAWMAMVSLLFALNGSGFLPASCSALGQFRGAP